jgi:hypothetical protein
MKVKFLLFFALLSSPVTFAQDTTWVQTFTFDSISTRRATFDFPQELNDMRFERVLMYYKLKCDPQTPWDQYNCGEWDYLAYSRIFDHTGDYDSVQVDGMRYVSNWMSPQNYSYEPYAANRMDQFVSSEQKRTGASTTLYPILAGNGVGAAVPFDLISQSNRYQMLLSATELNAGGITAGDLRSLSLFVPNGGVNGAGELLHPRISIKQTSDTDLTAFHATGFTEVYNLSRAAGAGGLISDGENEFVFHTPFGWNGTDNIIIEFFYDRSVLQNTDFINFEQDNSVASMAVGYQDRNGALELNGSSHAMMELSDLDLGDDVTIVFWAKGLGNTGVSTSILEAYDTLNNRILNIHMPWSNNRLYWDAGKGSSYDRIDKDMSGAGIDNEWHHWAFIKSTSTGEMKIMRDGQLWHSGTGFNLPVGAMHRFVIGSNKNLGNHWTGKIDEFQFYTTAVSEADIAAWYQKEVNATHPNWNELLVYYSFDKFNYALDKTGNDNLLMPSEIGMIDFNERPVLSLPADRVRIALGQGASAGTVTDVEVPLLKLKEPEVVFEYQPVHKHFAIVDAFLAMPEGAEDVYDASNTLVSSVPFSGSANLTNDTITYFNPPYEIIHNVEIGRFITPYGIQFDLGANGFKWVYDVTDYQEYLKDNVDFSCHNTQELIDIRFAFIEGIPPRDVHHREPIWSDHRSYSYNALDSDNALAAKKVMLSDTSSMFKIKTRFTGHGHHGSNNCCEWGAGSGRDHEILVDGVSRFNWEIWEETACGDNPNVSQGGTWPYAREGWCPGDLVKEYDHELTPFVTPGDSVTLDYDITDIPVNDPDQGSGNYVIAMDLISYGAPNHQIDGAIIDILNPNTWEYYEKWNPSCQNPRVIIQNTGEQTLTSARISVWIDWNNKVEYDWTGNLAFLEKEVVEIPIPDYTFWSDPGSSNTFTAHINFINQTWDDEYEQNNEITIPFEGPKQVYYPGLAYQGFLVWFKTNNKANENQWRLMDSEGNTIFERTSLLNSTDYKDTFNLEPGCYSIILEDSDSDGISFWYSSQTEGETAGSFVVKLVGGPIIENFEKDFGNYHQFNFTVGFYADNEELPEIQEEITIYPNPNNGEFGVEIVGNVDNNAVLTIFDLMGRQVHQEQMKATISNASSMVDLRHVESGHYLVKIVTPNGSYTKELIKN